MNAARFRSVGGLKSFLFIVIFGVALFPPWFYTQYIIKQLRNDAESITRSYAEKIAGAGNISDKGDITDYYQEFIDPTRFPIIVTDLDRVPIYWKGISVSSDKPSEKDKKKVQDLLNGMARKIKPLPVTYEDTILNYLYYGDSRQIQQLRWLSCIEAGIIGLFVLVGFIGYASIGRSEQRHIWVGMAKETAHQLGTPISSLMGWLEVMRSRKKVSRKDIIEEMEKDLFRLQRISTRFSQIGSKPDLKEADVASILKETAEYIQRRAPQLGRKVVIKESYAYVPLVGVNKDLFQWAAENVLKNGLDAMDKKAGEIHIWMGIRGDGKRIIIDIQDNGRGMEKSQQRRIFRPGYSTKKRGWGLGLTLAKRIIEEYHGGRLFVKESKPGIGTVIRIELKI